MATIKSKEQIIAEQRTFQRAYNRGIDTGDNSLTKDIILTPYAIGGEAIFDQISVVQDLHVLSRLSGTDLDAEAENYKLTRLPGTYAQVTLTYYTEITPGSDIIIPAGSSASTIGSSVTSPVIFSTISDATFSVADAGSYYSYDRARYEFPVTAACETIGAIGSVGANSINKIISVVTGLNGVTNLTAATGGYDSEIDDDLRKRILLKKTGRAINTPNGLAAFLRGLTFLDAYPVRQDAVDAERYDGVDVFVINNSSSSVTETFIYYPSAPNCFLTYRPVLEVTAVAGSIIGTLGSSDYDVNIDYTSQYRRSVYANDYVTLRGTAGLSPGEIVTITYNYASLITQSQDTLLLNENNVLTASSLIKAADPLYLFLNASLILKANADGPSTRTQCKNALMDMFSYYRLGQSVQKSDLIVCIQTGYGNFPVSTVDAVMITSYYLKDAQDNIYNPVNEVISVNSKQYALYGSATIT